MEESRQRFCLRNMEFASNDLIRHKFIVDKIIMEMFAAALAPVIDRANAGACS